MNKFKTMIESGLALAVPALLLVLTSSALAQGQSGPPTPTAEGSSPLIGYLLAVVLVVLLVVVSIIPSKRNFEDL